MEAPLDILWNLKQVILCEDPLSTNMRKHMALVILVNLLGNLVHVFMQADTDSFESSHKKYTASVWRGTSKRFGTLFKEITSASVTQS